MVKLRWIVLTVEVLLMAAPAAAQDFWQSGNGPYGGYVGALAATPDGSVFAGSSRGIFRSVDGGATWPLEGSVIGSYSIWSLAVNAQGYIFAGTEYNGILRSKDNGATWAKINSGFSAYWVTAIAVHPAGGDIYASSVDGQVYRSTDNGESWIQVGAGFTTRDVLALAVNAQGYVFAGTFNGGAFRSTDNGKTWSPINNGLENDDIRSFVFNASGEVFAGTWGDGVFRSSNNGDSWVKINRGFSADYVWQLRINANGHLFAVTTGSDDGVYRSIDNGGSWSRINTGLQPDKVDVRCMAISTTGVLYAGTEGTGLFRSVNNGDSWSESNSGLCAHSVNAFLSTPDKTLLCATTTGLFRSRDGTKSWTRVPNTFTYRGVDKLAVNNAGHIFAASGYPYRSTDNGNTWVQLKSGMEQAGSITAFAFYAPQLVFVSTYWDGIFRSTNNGDSWTAVNNGLSSLTVEALVVNISGDLFAGTRDGVFRSTDFGETWVPFNQGLSNYVEVRALAITASGHIYLGDFWRGVYRSTDNGESWTLAGLADQTIEYMAVNSLDHLFAATSSAVYCSKDQGTSWHALSTTGLPAFNIYSLYLDPDQFLYLGTYDCGTFRSVYPTTTILPPAVPLLSLPPDGAINRALKLTLYWEGVAEAASYHLEVAYDSSFADLVHDEANIVGTSRQVGPLAYNRTCYWRVSSSNSAGTSAWSKAWRFATQTKLPAQVALASPQNMAITNADSMLFIWHTSAPEVSRYWFELSINPEMADPAIDSTLAAGDTTKIVRQLHSPDVYWWRVRGGNRAGWGPFSEVRAFRFLMTAVDLADANPKEYELSQYYPNPFNQETEIRFALPQARHVTVTLYNALGAEIGLLTDQFYQAGRYSLKWDGRDSQGRPMASGIIFCSFQAGEFREIRKMSLLR